MGYVSPLPSDDKRLQRRYLQLVQEHLSPVQAVAEVCKPGMFDEVIVSTLPGQTSRWLRSDVPYRIGALTDLPVTHVVAISMARPTPRGAPLPQRKREALGLLNVMSYRGAHPRR